MSDSITLVEIDRRIARVERLVERIEGHMERLVRLEAEFGGVLNEINRLTQDQGRLEGRLASLEKDAPIVSLLKSWALRLVWGAAALGAAALVYMAKSGSVLGI